MSSCYLFLYVVNFNVGISESLFPFAEDNRTSF